MSSRIQHLAQLIDAGLLFVISGPIVVAMDDELMKMPWAPSRIRWALVPGAKVIPLSKDEKETLRLLRETNFGPHNYAVAFFSREDVAVGGRIEHIIENIDEIFWRAPGVRYVFGAEINQGELAVALADFVEYDSVGTLTGICRR